MVRIRYHVTGIVQGVGFRPFVYRVASQCGIVGAVRNTGGGVDIEAQADENRLAEFEQLLYNQIPPLARIDELTSEIVESNGDKCFQIIESDINHRTSTPIPPDIATCPDCLRELNDPSDRRYQYPFINCTNCGPRFTIVKEVPYDRAKTTMLEFPLCPDCEQEYRDPANRRFHAEPVACPVCGPKLWFIDANGDKVTGNDGAIQSTILAVKRGDIVAIKGLGGFHLACDSTNRKSVQLLRDRKSRRDKPLAVLFRDTAMVHDYCEISPAEIEELEHYRRPIVLLKQRSFPLHAAPVLAKELAPQLDEIGAFLPYTPIHHILFSDPTLPPLVMTSGNRSEEPIVIDNREAQEKLAGIADCFLLHDRTIWNRCDDSVGYVYQNQLILTRRSRGFTPVPVELPFEVPPMLAVGAMYCNTFVVASGKQAYFSQHIGDVDSMETLSYMYESIEKYLNWLHIKPGYIVHDRHPDLLTTRLGKELAKYYGVKTIDVQHHYAHYASALVAENLLNHKTLGIVFDGTGYGDDRTIWGGEFLCGGLHDMHRVGSLLPMRLPGGDIAIRKTYRTAIAYLHQLYRDSQILPLSIWDALPSDELQVIRQQVDRQFNTAVTSSIGRLFDAVSALLGVCRRSGYEGQAAIELEQLARRYEHEFEACSSVVTPCDIIDDNGLPRMDPTALYRSIVDALVRGEKHGRIAFDFHRALAISVFRMLERIAGDCECSDIVVCGGVFQNRLFTKLCTELAVERGTKLHLPTSIPVNDGGIALGQVVLAAAALEIERN